ncbi:outer membrane protein assembly factor [Reichenbachiella agarivorans]|uniref:Outer membrane protein assembly factor n=1 Tax=Reichenbachiella agarivorans TaxID=2979464 RepID=A0ABY6CMQ4_9BACT|nr:outer membrane protein assembly factor [Reichenbachiella agarivorans]UXP31791.1 outer membrane protein assembly factor [Reichenbachiella agarivorans]
MNQTKGIISRSAVIVMIIHCVMWLSATAQTDTTLVDQPLSKREAKKVKKNKPPEEGDIYFSPVPAIGMNPAFGFMYGVGAAVSSYLGDPADTKISTALAGLIFTTKKQTIFTVKSAAYTAHNDLILIGDWRYLDSSQPTYGLGTGPQSAKLVANGFEFDDGSSIDGIDQAQMLEFKWIRLYETVLKKINSGFYAGVGIHFDQFSDVNDQMLRLDSLDPQITSYYAYNVKHDFHQSESTLTGISLNGIYDTRDNQNNPYKGRYAYINFKMNPTWMGSDQSSTTLWLEYRDYFNFTPDNNNNILGFWTWGNFTTSGDLPYLLLPAIGTDQFAKSGRPYAQGRFRGQNMVYAETEFRKTVLATKNNPHFLGMVAFFNITTASAEGNDISLFDYVNKGYGLGLRIAFNQKARTNIGLDYGWGDYGTQGFYIKLNETF